ncbi:MULTISPECIES: hypothetical protein [Okeania]|uniref:Uncharacterized protein n=1 Tax=Okeania hirsuta TaxID=1458930 RepID=A0A3N6P1T5_9CYAN|nr:hypothetical protein [Okeania sp. SIO2B9]NET74846.1 hypothetical protein [Okeania sp. SIO1F9]RQH25920.1 hypothetical protein D4Z78_01665 [Okeania hirsuta]RQH54531.1 hypothetical protein D5R40_03155 [Okeania hirsuta]
MVKLGGVNPPPPLPGGEVSPQESGEERITKMSVVMTIEDFFYVQLNGFDIITHIPHFIMYYKKT